MDRRVSLWLARDPDPETRAELERIVAAGDNDEIERRLSRRLTFGTAGLRGVLGAGNSRMNRLVVRETTAGLGAYLLQTVAGAATRGVVVGYDGRHNSEIFSQDAASVLAALGIAVHLFEHEVPTPLCAFAVRHLGAAAAVVVTASHNPAAYNGYKVYWENGAQIIPPHDAGIAAAIERAARAEIPWCNAAEARSAGRIRSLGESTVAAYLDAIAQLSIHDSCPERGALRVAYTPLHGVGWQVARRALEGAGFTSVEVVAAQRDPDPDFPTVAFPNPEEAGAMDAALALASDMRADVIIANDPDADRLCVGIPDSAGGYRLLTGDQVGLLLGADFIAAAPARSVVGTTIVSSRMLSVVAHAHGVGFFETLTGFKWLVARGIAHEEQGERFLFAYEEALGYAIGSAVRDKDGISAMIAVLELAADCARRRTTLQEQLEILYRQHGLFLTRQQSVALDPDRHGPNVGDLLRSDPPTSIGGRAVRSVADLHTGVHKTTDGSEEQLDLPTSDVLIFQLAGDARVVVRPSGTEPKLKCYYEVCEQVGAGEPFRVAEGRANAALCDLATAHQAEIHALIGGA